jgi:flagellar operon protein
VDPRLTAVNRLGVVRPLEPLAPSARPASAPADGGFRAALDGAVGFRFSAHAEERLRSRGVSFDAGQLNRLGQGIDAAASKGSREALVLVDGVAMVIAVKNRTVVTAMSGDTNDGPSVFTNIDAAVIT